MSGNARSSGVGLKEIDRSANGAMWKGIAVGPNPLPNTNPAGTTALFNWTKNVTDTQDTMSIDGYSYFYFYAVSNANTWSSGQQVTLIVDRLSPNSPVLDAPTLGCGTVGFSFPWVLDKGSGTLTGYDRASSGYNFVSGVKY